MYRVLFIAIALLFSSSIDAADPEKKSGTASRIIKKPKIDGVLDDACWADAQPFDAFTQLEPNPGIPANKATSARIVYNDDAIYVAFEMKDVHPDSVLRELTARDDIGNTDWCGIFIDSYKDGNNGVGFLVTASGVQNDFKYSVFGEDVSWNAVWYSAVSVNADGWSAEMRIPYSALRFPDQPVQQWHVNFIRYRRVSREKWSWNYINPAINGFLNQSGYLNGISGITPPLRLQLFPYLSSYAIKSGDNYGSSFNGGMDIKYGLSDAFTLDMTLIPDFGQVQSDNRVLNLSPFEVRYQENRQFFTEGTELFNKGDLFYSRRIGETPIGYVTPIIESFSTGEEIINNPTDTRLINATKVSGRTSSGLGVGVFNAITREMYATLRDAEGKDRRVLTGPATNYNVLVVDQNMKNNSYITLINTNVTRQGEFYDANVTGTQFSFQDKKIKYQLAGFGAVSQLYGIGEGIKPITGSTHRMNFGKVSGNFTASVGYSTTSDRYEPNDMGFLLFNNTIDKNFNASYNWYKPFGWFNRASVSGYVTHTMIYNPRAFNNFGTGVEAFFMLKNFQAFGGFFSSEPITTYDYFEPRANFQRYYTYPVNNNIGAWISTDYRKRLAIDIDGNYRFFDEPGRTRVNLNFSPRFRVNNKLSFFYTYAISNWKNDVGYAVPNSIYDKDETNGAVALAPGDIYFGIRDQQTITNLLSAKYSFSNKSGITFRLRHYWSKVKYDNVYLLDDAGRLQSTAYSGRDAGGNSYYDNSLNVFNIDMVYSWVFSPGSELRLVWKNSIYGSEDSAVRDFNSNLNFLSEQSQVNSLSVKFLYFIDSGMLRRQKKA